MHSRGGIEDMASYAHATYDDDPVASIIGELSASADRAVHEGIERDRIVLDPGFGFSKLSSQSMLLLGRLAELAELGYPVMVGLSRKRFVTEAMLATDNNSAPPAASALAMQDRDAGTVAFNVFALQRGGKIFRVHNVRANRQGLDAAWSLFRASAH